MSSQSEKRSIALCAPHKAATLVEFLGQRASETPDRVAFTFLLDDEENVKLTYRELNVEAAAIAVLLRSMARQGDRILLLYPPGLEYISAFFGCLYAGMVAVPTYPPRLNQTLPRLQAVIANSEAAVALTTSGILSKIDPLLEQIPPLKAMQLIATDAIEATDSESWQMPALGADTLAFLQYTSGSTGAPKGVMVTHSNILYNNRMIHAAFQQTEESIIVGWLPLYHDMGLIGNVLHPIFVGAQCILMSPAAFLQRPLRWLRAIARYKATTSGGPNFAYDLCVRKASSEDRTTLDLSSWTVAFNGAEPIRAETIESFAATFGPCGFRREAFYPCYGLAEATLMVTGKKRSEPLAIKSFQVDAIENNRVAGQSKGPEGRSLVGTGRAVLEEEIIVVDRESLNPCQPSKTGEIWVSGPAVAQGYWGLPEESRRTFHAHLRDSPDKRFLRTGDLGFLHDGELFITGRLKDAIIIRGLNHYPQDIEYTVEQCHPAVIKNAGAAIALEFEGEERVAIVQEVQSRRTDFDGLIDLIRRSVSESHELELSVVALVRRGTIPKTSSGKIQRHACRKRLLSSELQVLAEWRERPQSTTACIEDHRREIPPTLDDIRGWLVSLIAAKLRIAEGDVDINRPIVGLGLDSLAGIEITHEIESALGVMLPLSDLLQSPSITQIAAHAISATRAPEAAASPVVNGESIDEYHLSRGQQALWFMQQLAPESGAYNLVSALRIAGNLDRLNFISAFDYLVSRHDAFRSSFVIDDEGRPLQRMHSASDLKIAEEDASGWSPQQLRDRLAKEALRPFRLDEGPPIRVFLFRRAVQEHILLMVAHHIVVDFWSLGVVLGELRLVYSLLKAGEQPDLQPPPVRYINYVRRQEAFLQTAEAKLMWFYWKKQLAGRLPPLNLPTDRPRPATQTYNGSSCSFTFNSELTTALRGVAHSFSATLYAVLGALFQSLLGRYTGQEDLIVGSPTAGRNSAALARTVGYFVNPVVLRGDLAGDPTFVTFLDRTRRSVLDAIENQDYPFVLLVERLQPERSRGRSPIFQVMFALQKTQFSGDIAALSLGEEGVTINFGSLKLETISLDRKAIQFDLFLMMAETGDEIRGSLQYNTDLFDRSTIERMTRHLTTLAGSAASYPGQRVSELPLLAASEEHQLLTDWNDTEAYIGEARPIHILFEQQVRRAPDSVAAIHQDQQISYGELNARANRLAHYLIRLGVEPDTPVGMCVPRSVEMFIGLLGILKAGGAYAPLDPHYPEQRLSFILSDVGAAVVVLTHSGSALRSLSEVPNRICLDTAYEVIGEEPSQNPVTAIGLSNLAYVIYTSGSTGRPKGVAIEHGSAAALLLWAKRAFESESLACVLASTSICFDLSVYEIFVPLICGTKVLLVENVLRLADSCEAEAVSLINTVPSAIVELLRTNGVPASVRTVNLAGEPLHNDIMRRLYELKTVRQVFNLYGPSEDTTYSTLALLEPGSRDKPGIGRPIGNSECYILAGDLRPVPIGVRGELYLSGAGLARGYYGWPDLTADKFIPCPFSTEHGTRMYKSGDEARYRADGDIDFIGRVDRQVKIRGYRIELEEIEAVLIRHPNIRDVVLTVNSNASGDRRLVAYVVTKEQVEPTVSTLRDYLRVEIPEYMIPSVFVVLDKLPLMPNGKVDLRSLPPPEHARADSERPFAPPRNAVEEKVAGIWSRLLNVEKIGVHDNFFELGGHSLLVSRLASRVRNEFMIDLPLQSFFSAPTIAEMSRKIERSTDSTRGRRTPHLAAIPRDGHLMELSPDGLVTLPDALENEV